MVRIGADHIGKPLIVEPPHGRAAADGRRSLPNPLRAFDEQCWQFREQFVDLNVDGASDAATKEVASLRRSALAGPTTE